MPTDQKPGHCQVYCNMLQYTWISTQLCKGTR